MGHSPTLVQTPSTRGRGNSPGQPAKTRRSARGRRGCGDLTLWVRSGTALHVARAVMVVPGYREGFSLNVGGRCRP